MKSLIFLKHISFLMGFLIILISITSCADKQTSDVDLGIVPGKIETYFEADTAFDTQEISIMKKFAGDYRDQQYTISIAYDKNYDEKAPSWKLGFGICQYVKHVYVYPTKGLLKIDDEEIEYESASSATIGKDELYIYYAFERNAEEIIDLLANATNVEFVAIGNKKQYFTWSPNIIEDAKHVMQYFDTVKSSDPVFTY
jgi:hypothetical protein